MSGLKENKTMPIAAKMSRNKPKVATATRVLVIIAIVASFNFSNYSAHAEGESNREFPLGRESGKQIMELRQKAHHVTSELAVITLTTITSSGEITNREILTATHRNQYDRHDYLIRFLAPQDIAGTTLLSHEKSLGEIEQYLYLPALGLVNKITGEARRNTFMGSDFTYEDLQRESTADYQYAYVGDTRIGTRPAYKVVAVASAPGNRRITGYARRILYLDKASLDIIKIEFFDASNIHEKTLEAYDFRSDEIEGTAVRPHRAVMSNHLKGTTSVMTLRKSRINIDIDPAYFTREKLKTLTEEKLLALLDSP